MQYTRPMIDLVYEIRRRVDANVKPSVKLANPEILNELATYYLQTKDTISKALIKELLNQAGEEWLSLLTPQALQDHEANKQVVKVYRGQTMLVDAPNTHPVAMDVVPASTHKVVRMYRGNPVV